MRYTNLVSSVLVLVLVGAGCTFTQPQNGIVKNTQPQANPPAQNDQQKVMPQQTGAESAKLANNDWENSKPAVFKDVDADFTFEYPSLLYVEKKNTNGVTAPDAHIWSFVSKSETVIGLFAPAYEAAFDGCINVEKERKPKNFYEDFDFYPTNDPGTTVFKQVCSQKTYIVWFNGKQPRSIGEFESLSADAKNKRLIVLTDVANLGADGKPSQAYIDWGEKIAKSITINNK